MSVDLFSTMQLSPDDWESMFNLPNQSARNDWTPETEDLYHTCVEEMGPVQLVVIPKKHIVTPEHGMSSRQRAIYEQLKQDPRLDDDILWMKRNTLGSLMGIGANRKVSGRIVDALMTKYPRFENVHYYIDVTDPKKTVYVPREQYETYTNANPGRELALFNISSEYRTQMNIYSKTFFDPFSRGVEVLHKLKDGTFVTFSICKLMFYRWSRDYHVFDFLRANYERITRVQREDQQRQRRYRKRKRKMALPDAHHKPKRRYRRVEAAFCPRILMPPKLPSNCYRAKTT